LVSFSPKCLLIDGASVQPCATKVAATSLRYLAELVYGSRKFI
jgi:hypothetical protein